VVEAHDVTSSDPRLLVYLKASRNTVPVPRHWCHKRKYLQGKRGMEKPPFRLPDFIADTGIARIRESVLESESLKKSKQKQRDKMTPKMGKIDIDYQVLHDAFFKYQTKPKMSGHGDLYYEGKEYEVDMKEKKPGVLSEELVTGLGMLENAPPPWLINMQRYGPPPSYPNLRIPGLNAPIPEGASYGYHPGGWGKPPVDEYGRPLYGDVFGAYAQEDHAVLESIDRSHWGELGAASSDSSSEEESESEEEEEDEERGRGRREHEGDGMETPLTLEGMSSVVSGLETPDTIDLRKREGVETPMSDAGGRELYRVIQEKKVQGAGGAQIFGSDRGYVIGKGAVEVSINPDELETELSGLKQKDNLRGAYEAQLAAQGGEGEYEDHDDPRQKRKRRAESGAQSKRHKDFKF
jgi:splicing factor 3B subunit 2